MWINPFTRLLSCLFLCVVVVNAGMAEKKPERTKNRKIAMDQQHDQLVFSVEEREWLDEHKTLRFTGDPSWLPYEAFDKTGQHIGIVADYLSLIEGKLGISIEIINTKTWPESVTLAQRGEVDILSETSDSSLSSILSFTDPYLTSPIVIVMKQGPFFVESIDEIKDKKISILKNYGFVPKVLERYPSIPFHWSDSIEEGLLSVSTGETDALIATLAQASYYMSELGINNVQIAGRTEFTTQLGFGIRQDYAPLVSLFNRALDSITTEQRQAVLDKWGRQHFVSKFDFTLLLQLVAVLLYIIVIFIYWNRKLAREVKSRKELEAQTQALIDHVPEQIFVTTPGGQILSANSQAIKNFGLQDNKLDQYNATSFYVNKKERTELWAEIKEHGEVNQKVMSFRHVNGSIQSMIVSAIPVVYKRQSAILTIAVDITERLNIERALKESQDRFELAAQGSGIGLWEYVADTGDYWFSQRFSELLGYGDSKELLTPAIWKASIHTEDKAASFAAFDAHIAADVPYDIEFKMQTKQGEWRWFSGMAKSLRDEQGRAYRTSGSMADITKRKTIEKQLKDAKQVAETANRYKSEFLSNMSHEIRTPLNAILGFTGLLKEQVKEPKQATFVKTIHSAGINLLTLINDILDLSKIEAGKIEIRKKACNLHDLFREIADTFSMQMVEKGIHFSLDMDSKIPDNLYIDSQRLSQVLLNLVGNAVKFTDTGFIRISVQVKSEDPNYSKLDLLIKVEDSGRGIARPDHERVFETFGQSSDRQLKNHGGTGLGLSISKRLVDLMQGELSLVSKLGVGTTFFVRLYGVDVAALSTETKPLKNEQVSSITFLPAQVLIVDDVDDNRLLLEELFANTALQTISADSGAEAVKLAESRQFDVILMDIKMPLMDGYEAAKKIKSFSDTPIIAITASVMGGVFEKTERTHFDGYLRKPTIKSELFNELKKFLAIESSQDGSRGQAFVFSTEQLLQVEKALPELEALLEKSVLLQETNDFSQIDTFSRLLARMAKRYSIVLLSEYVNELQGQSQAYSVKGVLASLKQFSELFNQLNEAVKQSHKGRSN